MPSSPQQDKQKRAVVIGSGLAGLAASSNSSLKIEVLNIKASSGINGAETSYQLASSPSIADSAERFYEDLVKSAGEVMRASGNGKETKERETLIKVLSKESKESVQWLGSKGVDFNVVAQLGGHSIARTHRGGAKSKPPGAAIIGTLLEELKKNEKSFDIRNWWICRRCIWCTITISTGFIWIPFYNDPRPGSQKLLTDIGAGLTDMEKVQVHPTAFVDAKDINNPTKFLAAEMLRGEGGVLLVGGKRFVDELETRKVVTEKIMEFEGVKSEKGKPRQWDVKLVIDEGVYEKTKSHMDFYLWKGLMRKCTIAEAGLGEEAEGIWILEVGSGEV
ncbi:hypothetical protein DID88_006350 [Monilinia fructigena]|uniref:FAD-dependent oxidoreductase 2 FAD-binding domain-containing protein n=1 Tax=Monilinia fructigena TaxID=38457 RepID=A0A395J342_9HELO|nr:hypothetical protein DID88_006350 [Monilinia fructigena]